LRAAARVRSWKTRIPSLVARAAQLVEIARAFGEVTDGLCRVFVEARQRQKASTCAAHEVVERVDHQSASLKETPTVACSLPYVLGSTLGPVFEQRRVDTNIDGRVFGHIQKRHVVFCPCVDGRIEWFVDGELRGRATTRHRHRAQ
jgi:hypothetical protein